MRVLLDTHIWLWGHLEPQRLGTDVKAILEDARTELWLSPISVWEALLLAEKGRIDIGPSPTVWVDTWLANVPMREAVLDRRVAVASRRVELAHDDPADRFLAATAAVYELVLVTADSRLIDCPSMQVMANR